ncbi:MAG: hypothetical protein V1873_07835, partial [Verrucomicrobiota bacterium]
MKSYVTKPVQVLVAVLIASVSSILARAETLENRDGKSLIASWWGSDSAAPYVYQLDFGSTQKVHSGKYALKIGFNKANDPGNTYS